ncbi:arylsulfatase [Flavobacterium granuli]|uniref:Arylsulfatase A-like enzyme n=1 Tax=Flavobacterium granuli TaxID=280093 RepID=A0ABU1S0Z9_9FLAO|nr:arylsulfatase [Flavobacterium granuli]MDR6844676.1 arylsulfatase A-like enzyme [Flavobacterium granuli]
MNRIIMEKSTVIRLLSFVLFLIGVTAFCQKKGSAAKSTPNVIIIYADDLGYGDLSCYGATKIKTPNIDKLAAQGVRMTNAHATAATCTPSRYSLMTGQYPWRKQGTGILPGDAALIIPTDKLTLPLLFKKAGYTTGIVGKWHLGIGDSVEKNWNQELKPGPNEVGFDYSFIFPATADRVPTVFVENGKVLGAEASDPIMVSYNKQIGNDPIGATHPELLKMKASLNHGHDGTIVNGIGRIGFMSGGTKARWTDEEVPLTFLEKAKLFMEQNKNQPFFLYYSVTEPHVPRMPSTAFRGKSELGYRGDAILQLDWSVGEVMKQLKYLGIEKNTIIVFSSDNGPVLDDGYQDEAVSKQNGHNPWGALRGGKYSAFEAGTRVPLIINWPTQIKPKISDALVSQVDFIASFNQLLGMNIKNDEFLDSQNMWEAFIGESNFGREVLIKQGGAYSVIKGNWKYIKAQKGDSFWPLQNIETGTSELPQLYDLRKDIGEINNLASQFPEKVKELEKFLNEKLDIKK